MAVTDKHYYKYTDDDGTEYKVLLSERVAVNGGFELASGTEAGGIWINRGRRRMRHVGIKIVEDGRRGQFPCASLAGGHYTTIGATVPINWPDKTTGAFAARNAVITGRIGERGGN